MLIKLFQKISHAQALSIVLMILVAITSAHFLFTGSRVSNASTAIASKYLGVYYDLELTKRVYSIEWGALTPDEHREIEVYVQNEGAEPLCPSLATDNWTPADAPSYLRFSWSSDKTWIKPGEVTTVTQSLHVSSGIKKVLNFSFDILFQARNYLIMEDFVSLFAENPKAKMIYPSLNSPKPLNCSAAMVSDWTASAFIFTKLSNATEGLDIEANFVDPTTGKVHGDIGTGIVTFGGPIVNPVVKYAESVSTIESDQAPIRFHDQDGIYSFQQRNGSDIPGTSLPTTVINSNQDMFVIEIYRDTAGRYIMLCYGFGWKGTYAAGKYFDTLIYPDLNSHTESWIVVKWDDTNGDGFVNTSKDGDTYTVISKGN